MLKKAKDPSDLPIILMEYHAASLPKIKYSPSQLFLNRLIKTKIPSLEPILPNKLDVKTKLQAKQETHVKYYNRNSKDLKKLVKGKVVGTVNDRSYIVENIYGCIYRRNRKYLRKTKLVFHHKQNEDLIYDFNSNGLNNILSASPELFTVNVDNDHTR
nr:unnamed protein product [Callosobruchus analis]